MLVSQVALGNTLHVTEHDLDLTSPPQGYNSVHGMKAAGDVQSQFKVSALVLGAYIYYPWLEKITRHQPSACSRVNMPRSECCEIGCKRGMLLLHVA